MTLFTPPHLRDGHRWRGMRVGILGGSFNPPHAGHVHISAIAMKMLQLDCIWWLVTPGNPFKRGSNTLPYAERLRQCRILNHDPRVIISDLEEQMGTIRTVDTFTAMKKIFPQTQFVMIGGMDIAHEIPRWSRWRQLPKLTAMAFIARPPESSLVRQNGMRMTGWQNHRVLLGSGKAALTPGSCYWILQSQMNYQSSTKVREKQFNKYVRLSF